MVIRLHTPRNRRIDDHDPPPLQHRQRVAVSSNRYQHSPPGMHANSQRSSRHVRKFTQLQPPRCQRQTRVPDFTPCGPPCPLWLKMLLFPGRQQEPTPRTNKLTMVYVLLYTWANSVDRSLNAVA